MYYIEESTSWDDEDTNFKIAIEKANKIRIHNTLAHEFESHGCESLPNDINVLSIDNKILDLIMDIDDSLTWNDAKIILHRIYRNYSFMADCIFVNDFPIGCFVYDPKLDQKYEYIVNAAITTDLYQIQNQVKIESGIPYGDYYGIFNEKLLYIQYRGDMTVFPYTQKYVIFIGKP